MARVAVATALALAYAASADAFAFVPHTTPHSLSGRLRAAAPSVRSVRPRLQLGRLRAQLRPEDEDMKRADPKNNFGSAWKEFVQAAQEVRACIFDAANVDQPCWLLRISDMLALGHERAPTCTLHTCGCPKCKSWELTLFLLLFRLRYLCLCPCLCPCLVPLLFLLLARLLHFRFLFLGSPPPCLAPVSRLFHFDDVRYLVMCRVGLVVHRTAPHLLRRCPTHSSCRCGLA